jgi:hypothetical protein
LNAHPPSNACGRMATSGVMSRCSGPSGGAGRPVRDDGGRDDGAGRREMEHAAGAGPDRAREPLKAAIGQAPCDGVQHCAPSAVRAIRLPRSHAARPHAACSKAACSTGASQ